jgi:hypothetical protein
MYPGRCVGAQGRGPCEHSLETLAFRAPRGSSVSKAEALWPQGGLGDSSLGGVSDHGTLHEDDPETWESLAHPRRKQARRGACTEISNAPTVGHTDGRVRRSAQPRWAARRGTTRAAAEAGETSEGRIGAVTSGNGRQPDPAEQRRPVSR